MKFDGSTMPSSSCALAQQGVTFCNNSSVAFFLNYGVNNKIQSKVRLVLWELIFFIYFWASVVTKGVSTMKSSREIVLAHREHDRRVNIYLFTLISLKKN